MGEKRTTFSSAQRSNEKWRARRAHMKIRDDANPINIRRIGVSTAFTRIPLLIPLSTPAPPPSRPLFTVPAWCPMNHRLKRRVRQHSPKSFFTSLDWYKRDLTTTCRKLEGNWRKAKKDGEGRITLYLVFTHCSFSRSKHHAPTSQITPPFYIPFSFYILPLCYFTFFYYPSPFWSLFISIPTLHLLFLFI